MPPAVEPPAEVRADERPPPATRPDVLTPGLHALALFTVVRASEAYLYPIPFADFESRALAHRWADAVTRPPIFYPRRRAFEWDGDPWPINVVGHGLMGSELYVRARTCNLGVGGALAFAAVASGVWEYAFEGNGVRPSALDLVYTPLAGLALGEARFQVWRAAGGLSGRAARAVARSVVDPFGEIERALGTRC